MCSHRERRTHVPLTMDHAQARYVVCGDDGEPAGEPARQRMRVQLPGGGHNAYSMQLDGAE